MSDLLVAAKVRKEFGGLVAVNDVDFTIPERAIVSLIGPNGAGKTTFFNCLTGVYKPTGGQIVFAGDDVTGKPPHAVTERGIGRTFQNIRLFKEMTARENVMVGMHSRLKGGIVKSVLRTPGVKREEREAVERARELLAFCGLQRNQWEEWARNLSYGDQRRLEVARALATQPKLILLDEPTAGMNPQETADFTAFVARLREEEGLTVLLIEHDMRVVMGVSDRRDGARLRREDRRGSAGGGAEGPEGDRGLSRLRGGGAVTETVAERAPTGSADRNKILELDDVHTYYGSIHAIKGVTLDVYDGEVVTLIGANGAGKSTTLRSINGLNHPRKGSIRFQGRDITQESPHDVVKMGISQSPEGRRLFPRMSVMENLEMGAFQRNDKAGIRESLDRVFELFPRLQERKNQRAGTMSGGEQQMCAIGRALMAQPKLLLLDEPSMGLAPIFVERIFEIVVEINKQGTPILLVEQNALMALDVANRGYVMETGVIALADDAKSLAQNEQVRKTYLGES